MQLSPTLSFDCSLLRSETKVTNQKAFNKKASDSSGTQKDTIYPSIPAHIQPARASSSSLKYGSRKVAIIGTGCMGSVLGKRFVDIGWQVTYGSRTPESEHARSLITSPGICVCSQREAVKEVEAIVLAVNWPEVKDVAANLGNLSGKTIIDVSNPMRQNTQDGYFEHSEATSGAELIQQLHPDAKVVKAFNIIGDYVIKDPSITHSPVTVPIASNDKEAKEQTSRVVYEMGLKPVDFGPLRMALYLEGMAVAYMTPLVQRRDEGWEFSFQTTNHWKTFSDGSWWEPVKDRDNLAQLPREPATGAALNNL